MRINNLFKLFNNGGPSGGWSEATRANYGAGISRLLAACLEKLDLTDEDQILQMLGQDTSRDNQTIARNVRVWLGLK